MILLHVAEKASEVPQSLNIIAWLCVPLLAFVLPLYLLKLLPEARRTKRLPAMLAAGLPALVVASLVAELFTGDWFQGIQEGAGEMLNAKRYPPSVADLLLRTGIAGLGAFALIWISGVIGERMSDDDQRGDADNASDSADASTSSATKGDV